MENMNKFPSHKLAASYARCHFADATVADFQMRYKNQIKSISQRNRNKSNMQH